MSKVNFKNNVALGGISYYVCLSKYHLKDPLTRTIFRARDTNRKCKLAAIWGKFQQIAANIAPEFCQNCTEIGATLHLRFSSQDGARQSASRIAQEIACVNGSQRRRIWAAAGHPFTF